MSTNQSASAINEAQLAVEHADRQLFEHETWHYYQNLKAHGWSSPEEGDTTRPEALFWREPSGKYGVAQIAAAWWGWQMKGRVNAVANDLQTRLDLYQSWHADDSRRIAHLEQHLNGALEIAQTWQPDYATKMDRDTLQYARECLDESKTPERKVIAWRVLKPDGTAMTSWINGEPTDDIPAMIPPGGKLQRAYE